MLQRSLKQYRVVFYESLRKKLLQDNIKFEIIYGQDNKMETFKQDNISLDWAIRINNIHLPFGIFWQHCWSYLKNADLVIIGQFNKALINYPLMVKRLFSKQKLAFWGHGTTRQKRPNSINNIFKKAIMKNVDWWFAYTPGVSDFIVSRGFPKDKVTVFQNTIDTKALIEAKGRTTQNELDRYKKRLDLGNGSIGIFCGSMYPEKRIKFLLDACQMIKEAIPNFEMIFLGGGEDARFVKESARDNNWIHYIGPCFGNDKIPYFMLADILLMPGLVGLAVLDSFALGVPIVTTDYPYHSPEVEYIQNGINGIITKNNLESFTEAVKDVLSEPDKMNRLKAGCRVSADYYTMENMVDNFTKGIKTCLSC